MKGLSMELSEEFRETYMRRCIEVAKLAAWGGSGAAAMVVRGGSVTAASGGSQATSADPHHHPEMEVLGAAVRQHTPARPLADAVLFTTLEPCPVCSAAVMRAGFGAVVIGVPRAEAVKLGQPQATEEQWSEILNLPVRDPAFERGTPPLTVYKGVLREECAALMA